MQGINSRRTLNGEVVMEDEIITTDVPETSEEELEEVNIDTSEDIENKETQENDIKEEVRYTQEEVNKMKFTATMSEADFNIQKANCLARMKALFLLHRNSMIQYRKRLKSLGYKERDTYKLMQGHCLYNSIVKNLLFSICKAIFEKRLSALVKNTPSPDHAALKKEVYAVTAMHGSLREYINEAFYYNRTLRNHVPAALQQKLTDSYS